MEYIRLLVYGRQMVNRWLFPRNSKRSVVTLSWNCKSKYSKSFLVSEGMCRTPSKEMRLCSKSSWRELEDTGTVSFRTIKPSNSGKNLGNTHVCVDHKTENLFEVTETSCPVTHRFNEFNIQMLPDALHRRLFGINTRDAPTRDTARARQDLERRGFLGKTSATVADPRLQLPRLRGTNVEEHFRIIGEEQSQPYRALLQKLTTSELPPCPSFWIFQEGWTRYVRDTPPEPIDFPSCDALVLDVEVCLSAGQEPTLATAVSPEAWYCWVNPRLVNANATEGKPSRYSCEQFFPLESGPMASKFSSEMKERPRVIVGHNVSYDRARVREQYWLERSALRFVDTMSLHVCVGGLSSGQRATLRSSAAASAADAAWREVAALNSLSDVHRLYCGFPLKKEGRDIFVSGKLEDIRTNFQNSATYCAQDVIATWRVLSALLPLFLERFPHPVTLAGLLELSSAYLPVRETWPRFLAAAEITYEELRAESRRLLARAAADACCLMHNKAYRRDPWMWDQDWSFQELRLLKNASKKLSNNEDGFDIEEWPVKFRALAATRFRLPARRPLLPGYPAWYRSLCERPSSEDWTPGPIRLSTGLQVTPKLLRMTWEGYPLHFLREHGWGFLVPNAKESELDKNEIKDDRNNFPAVPMQEIREVCAATGATAWRISEVSPGDVGTVRREVQDRLGWASYRGGVDGVASSSPPWYRGTGVSCGAIVGDCWFLKLPHKDGAPRVGSPLSRDFVGAFEAGVLTGAGPEAARVLDVGRQLSYWRNNRERVLGQLVGWIPSALLPKSLRGQEIGAIVPQIVVAGTLTRRAVEPTWMTAANALPGRLGSELRALVHAPPEYVFVGADVDSQELWIAAVLGDAAAAGVHGATPFGWMTLSGKKADCTDMHSVTATAAGVSRDQAKVLNYARIYGAGPRFAQLLLQRFNPALSDAEARERASKMFTLTKGQRTWHVRSEWQAAARAAGPLRVKSLYAARRIAEALGAPMQEVFEQPQWEGGTESAMFNRLEEIANASQPATPFLNGRLSRALEVASSENTGGDDRFLPTRVNWVVQSGAVDFLHLMLVCMRWLQPRARFCLSFHDEVRYMVTEKDRYNAALALHITNLMTRAFCSYRLGLRDLPISVAFFASVEVDRVLRKDAHHNCVTPSNPHGLQRGYGLPPGEALDIYETVRLAGRTVQTQSARRKTFPTIDSTISEETRHSRVVDR